MFVRRNLALLGAIGVVVLGISGCGGPTRTSHAARAGDTAEAGGAALRWLTSSSGPARLYQDGVPTAWRSTWAIMNTGACHQLPAGAVPAYWFGDYNAFTAAVSDGEIAGRKATPNGCTFAYRAVVVDYENWSNTPVAQREQWKTYVQDAYTRAHGLGLTVIQAMTHGVPADSGLCAGGWSGYFGCGAPGYEARFADVVDLQAQQEEADLSGRQGSFTYEVSTGTAQARAANHRVLVLAGMRSSAQAGDGSCAQIPSATLLRDWAAVSREVDGAWLNVNCDEHTFTPLLRGLYP